MSLNDIEKKTFILLLIATFFNGFIHALARIQDIIAKKALDGLDWQITVIVMLWPVANFFSIWWGKLLERTEKKSRYFLLVAFIGRLILITGLWVVNVNQFILILAVVHSFSSLFIPLQNSLIQNNFRPHIRGKLFGISISILTGVILVVSVISGRLLDMHEEYYKFMLFIIGVMGFIGSFLLSRAKFNKRKITVVNNPLNLRELFISPITRTIEVMTTNKTFAKFELSFIIYGTGYLIVLPVIPKYMVETLNMSYTQTFMAKGFAGQLGIILLAPFAGRFFDTNNPCTYTGYAFGLLILYPLCFLISSFFSSVTVAIIFVFLSFLLFGVAMSAIQISWNISSIFFAGDEDASMFQSVHVSLTGVRGLIVPPLGYLIMRFISYRMVFVVSALALGVASYLSFRLSKNLKCKPQ